MMAGVKSPKAEARAAALDWSAMALLLVLCAIWGLGQSESDPARLGR